MFVFCLVVVVVFVFVFCCCFIFVVVVCFSFVVIVCLFVCFGGVFCSFVCWGCGVFCLFAFVFTPSVFSVVSLSLSAAADSPVHPSSSLTIFFVIVIILTASTFLHEGNCTAEH